MSFNRWMVKQNAVPSYHVTLFSSKTHYGDNASTWLNLQKITLSKISQIPKCYTLYMIPLIQYSLSDKIIETKNKLVIAKG